MESNMRRFFFWLGIVISVITIFGGITAIIAVVYWIIYAHITHEIDRQAMIQAYTKSMDRDDY